MSHELRTPLNSILILAQQLADNVEGNLTPKQGEFARTIHGAGTDLLNLITDILDLSKIESGTVTVMAEEVVLGSLLDGIARPFRHEAESRRLSFELELDPSLGSTIITDAKRLQQVLKNLVSNAVKFTEQGSVRLTVAPARGGWSGTHPVLDRAANVIAFEVTDTGIGISPRSSASSSRPSSRPMPAPAASTAAPAWASPSAASSPSCLVARSSSAARRGWAAPSRSSCPMPMSVRRSTRRPSCCPRPSSAPRVRFAPRRRSRSRFPMTGRRS
jgi:hypothetical protein